MAAGIQVYNPDGSLQFDAGSRLFRVLTVALAGSGGSFSNPEISSGSVIVGVTSSNPELKQPTVTQSGSTVSWGFGSTPTYQRDTDAIISVVSY